MAMAVGSIRTGLLILVAALAACSPRAARAQEPVPNSDKPLGSGLIIDLHPRQPGHRFWDHENIWLFSGVGASRTLDYFSTLNMRRRGRQEIFLNNDTVDNHPAFGFIEAAATGVSIGSSYLFHRSGH